MFLTVEWAKRWLPAVFLLLSLFLPWWTLVRSEYQEPYAGTHVRLSFPWADVLEFDYKSRLKEIHADAWFPVYDFPRLLFVSVLIMVAGLCGLTDNNKTRTFGGLLGIAGVVSYFMLVLLIPVEILEELWWATGLNPYFGMNVIETPRTSHTFIWFLSVGFYLALAGSLMLLSPIIRTGIERIRKRSSSSKQIIKEQLGTSNKKEGSLGE